MIRASYLSAFRVCLVEKILGRMKKKKKKKEREKMRRENFLKGIWLGGGKEKEMVGPMCFLSEPP